MITSLAPLRTRLLHHCPALWCALPNETFFTLYAVTASLLPKFLMYFPVDLSSFCLLLHHHKNALDFKPVLNICRPHLSDRTCEKFGISEREKVRLQLSIWTSVVWFVKINRSLLLKTTIKPDLCKKHCVSNCFVTIICIAMILETVM